MKLNMKLSGAMGIGCYLYLIFSIFLLTSCSEESAELQDGHAGIATARATAVVYMENFTPSGNEAVGTEVTLVDKRDGISYRCIKMADGRWWMGENLRYETATGSSVYNNDPANLETYGRLYDWQTAQDNAPEGWSVPTDEEWKALEIALGMSAEDVDYSGDWRNSGSVGAQLKENGSSGMGLQLSGEIYNGNHYDLGRVGFYWCSSAYDASYVWFRFVEIGRDGVNRAYNIPTAHFAVRCILKEKKTYLQDFVPSGNEAVGTEVSLVDKRDGISYRCIKMADGRWWMGENLRYETASGSSVYNNDPANLETYGRLYDWQTAQDNAPEGWSVPTDEEWKALEIVLGMTSADADATTTWRNSGNVGTQLKGNGSSGMELQLSGYQHVNGTFFYLNTYGRYWTSTESGATAWDRDVYSTKAGVYRGPFSKAYRYAVRCVRNL